MYMYMCVYIIIFRFEVVSYTHMVTYTVFVCVSLWLLYNNGLLSCDIGSQGDDYPLA